MSINCRFALDEERHIIDAVNAANSGKAYYSHEGHEGDPEDDKYLRERVLMVRLGAMLRKLIINLRPMKKLPSGEIYKPHNEESFAIWLTLLETIRASHLNTFDPVLSIRHKFDGKLKSQKKHTQDFTSLAFFRDDVECLLRDLYGDIESEALDSVLRAVFRLLNSLRNLCVRIFRKNIGTPRILTTCWASVCQMGMRLMAVTGAAEWRRNSISSYVFTRFSKNRPRSVTIQSILQTGSARNGTAAQTVSVNL